MEFLKTTTTNYSGTYTTRIPSKVKTYQTVGYLLTDAERTVVIVVLCSIAGIIVVTGIIFRVAYFRIDKFMTVIQNINL